MKKYRFSLAFCLIIILFAGVSEASIISNTNAVYIGGSPPVIIDNPEDYFLTISEVPEAREISNQQNIYGGEYTSKPIAENGRYVGYHQNSAFETKRGIQNIGLEDYSGFNVIIFTIKPTTDSDLIWQNIKDTITLTSKYEATFENIPGLGDRAFYQPATSTQISGNLYVQKGNIIISVMGYPEPNKLTLIGFATRYLDKISEVNKNQPNLIIQASSDKKELEVGDTFDINFKSTSDAQITVKNNGKIVDSFVLTHSTSRNYKVDEANGNENIEITGINSKGKSDVEYLSITTKEKATPTPTPTPNPVITPNQASNQSSGFGINFAIFGLMIIYFIRRKL